MYGWILKIATKTFLKLSKMHFIQSNMGGLPMKNNVSNASKSQYKAMLIVWNMRV